MTCMKTVFSLARLKGQSLGFFSCEFNGMDNYQPTEIHKLCSFHFPSYREKGKHLDKTAKYEKMKCDSKHIFPSYLCSYIVRKRNNPCTENISGTL